MCLSGFFSLPGFLHRRISKLGTDTYMSLGGIFETTCTSQVSEAVGTGQAHLCFEAAFCHLGAHVSLFPTYHWVASAHPSWCPPASPPAPR